MDNAVALVVMVGIIGLLVYRFNPWAIANRRTRARWAAWQRDLEAARAWVRICDAENNDSSLHVAHVTDCYGVYPRRGTKVWITWRQPQMVPGSPLHYSGMVVPQAQDAWFERQWPSQGCWVLLRGKTGYGPHNHNPNTFYVDCWLDAAPSGAPDAWQRCTAANWTPPVQPS
jgi:hypothetical protein